jgi:hypothetical protein
VRPKAQKFRVKIKGDPPLDPACPTIRLQTVSTNLNAHGYFRINDGEC